MGGNDRRGGRIVRRVLVVVAALLVAAGIAFGAYVSDYSRAGSAAQEIISAGAAADATIRVDEGDSFIAVGDSTAEYGVVFYPGGKVAPEAYVPLAAKLARRGVFCVIPKMPFNLAVFNINAADSVFDAYPNVTHWWVGGHSLGGAMAASYAASNASKVEGVALLAAYASDDLAALGLKVVVVYGSNDGVVNREKLGSCIAQLPADSALEIAGGNHAGFGDYGVQSGDNEASISADDQQEQAAGAVVAAMLG